MSRMLFMKQIIFFIFIMLFIISCAIATEQAYEVDFSNTKFPNYQKMIFARLINQYTGVPSHLELKKEEIFIDTIDLNEDGVDEIFVYENNKIVCGYNVCAITVFKRDSHNNLLALLKTTSSNIISIIPTKTNGFHDIEFATVAGNKQIWKFNNIKQQYEH